MRGRPWLVGVSLVVHLAVVFGLFVAGMWRIDRLDPAKHRIDLWTSAEPPPPAAGGQAPKARKITPKVVRHIVHDVQPEPRVVESPTPATNEDPGIDGSGTGPGSGSDGSDTCLIDCGTGPAVPAPPPPPPPPPSPTMVAPVVLRGLRISGETQIQAPDVVKTQMRLDGKDQVTAIFKVCLDTRGDVGSLGMLRSSGYAPYDADLLAAVRAWRYHPYSVNGAAVPVCGVVTFIYAMK